MSTHTHLILEALKAGNQRFLSGLSTQRSEISLEKLKHFSKTGQFPKAVILCCSDSRAPVEMIFDQDIGDLFVIRVAGNVVAPSLVGSVEFAVSRFNTSLVVVMGHTQCGAIQATLDDIAGIAKNYSDNIHDIVSRIKPHVLPIATAPHLNAEEKSLKAVEANIMAAAHQLSHSSTLIERLILEKKIEISPALLQLESGEVRFL